MKKLILGVSITLGILAYGADALQVQTMQSLEKSLAMVQKGVMYNSAAMVKDGTSALKKAAQHIDSFKISNTGKEGFNPKQFAHNEAVALSHLADALQTAIEKKDKDAVVETYGKLQNQCITCHMLVRKW